MQKQRAIEETFQLLDVDSAVKITADEVIMCDPTRTDGILVIQPFPVSFRFQLENMSMLW